MKNVSVLAFSSSYKVTFNKFVTAKYDAWAVSSHFATDSQSVLASSPAKDTWRS